MSPEPFWAGSKIYTIVTYDPETHLDVIKKKFKRSDWQESSNYVQNVQNFIFFMIFGHNCSCPITRDCAFVYTNLFFIDIKMCLRVIGNYGMNFRPGLIWLQDSHKVPRRPQMKNGNPRLLHSSQKIKTYFYFFLIIGPQYHIYSKVNTGSNWSGYVSVMSDN